MFLFGLRMFVHVQECSFTCLCWSEFSGFLSSHLFCHPQSNERIHISSKPCYIQLKETRIIWVQVCLHLYPQYLPFHFHKFPCVQESIQKQFYSLENFKHHIADRIKTHLIEITTEFVHHYTLQCCSAVWQNAKFQSFLFLNSNSMP